MKEFELKGLDQNIFYEEIPNGLKVVLIPFKNKKNYYACYTTKYGSVNLDFVPKDSNKMMSSPMGIAHFLEHKLFEQESGESPFEFFSKSGTGCNAGTSYKKTSYYIYGVNALEENLDYLISFVNSPYFTDTNVEKEKGIIIEEIKMYDDNPEWILTEEVQKSTFKNHPIRYDVAGYEDTVSKITKEDLYNCYNTFYSPNNMFLVVAGNFEPDKIMELIKSNKELNSKDKGQSIKQKDYKEPFEVNEKYKEIAFPNISIPKVATNIKLSLKDVKDKYEYSTYIMALVSLMFGSSSDFKEEMLVKKYITSFSAGSMMVDDYFIIEFYAESEKPKEFIEKLIDNFKNIKITKEQLERYKKVKIASIVMNSDNVESVSEDIINDYITWDKIIDNQIEIVRNMNIECLNKIVEDLDIDNNATVVLKQK